MAATTKQKFSLDTSINPFGEFKGKQPPVWLYAVPKEANKIKVFSFKRQMMLDPRKWKMKDLVDGCYAVARFELALFATQTVKTEATLLKKANLQLGKKYKKLADLQKFEDPGKNKTLAKVYEDAAKELLKNYASLTKKVEDKVSLALDAAESDKGDNKKSISECKAAVRKFNQADFREAVKTPVTNAAKAMMVLSGGLKSSASKLSPKEVLEAALKDVKAAESAYETKGKKVKGAASALIQLAEVMTGDKKADSSIPETGKMIDKKSKTGKALSAIKAVMDDLEDELDEARNTISRGLKNDDKEAEMLRLANRADSEAKNMLSLAKRFSDHAKVAKVGMRNFESAFKKVEKELKG